MRNPLTNMFIRNQVRKISSIPLISLQVNTINQRSKTIRLMRRTTTLMSTLTINKYTTSLRNSILNQISKLRKIHSLINILTSLIRRLHNLILRNMTINSLSSNRQRNRNMHITRRHLISNKPNRQIVLIKLTMNLRIFQLQITLSNLTHHKSLNIRRLNMNMRRTILILSIRLINSILTNLINSLRINNIRFRMLIIMIINRTRPPSLMNLIILPNISISTMMSLITRRNNLTISTSHQILLHILLS